MGASAPLRSASIATARRSARRRLRLDVLGVNGGGATFNAVLHDLSATGMLIETSAPLTVGDEIQIDAPQNEQLKAAIMWSQGDYFGCELEVAVSRAGMSAALLKSSVELELSLQPREEEVGGRQQAGSNDPVPQLPLIKRALAVAALALLCWAPLVIAGRAIFR